jgi:hypothetical protein
MPDLGRAPLKSQQPRTAPNRAISPACIPLALPCHLHLPYEVVFNWQDGQDKPRDLSYEKKLLLKVQEGMIALLLVIGCSWSVGAFYAGPLSILALAAPIALVTASSWQCARSINQVR